MPLTSALVVWHQVGLYDFKASLVYRGRGDREGERGIKRERESGEERQTEGERRRGRKGDREREKEKSHMMKVYNHKDKLHAHGQAMFFHRSI